MHSYWSRNIGYGVVGRTKWQGVKVQMKKVFLKKVVIFLLLICCSFMICPQSAMITMAKENTSYKTHESENDDDEEEEVDEPALEMGKITTTSLSSTKVRLRFKAVEGAESYQIYRRGNSYKKIATVTDTTYIDNTVKDEMQYHYKVVPVSESGKEGIPSVVSFKREQAVNITKQKYSYVQMQSDLKQLEKMYGDYCQIYKVGKSQEGRIIYDVAIGNKEAAKSVAVVCTLHAREYVCSVLAMRQIEYYLRNYNGKVNGRKPSYVLENVRIHYIVMANPDGVFISQNRKARWKANARGVDLNRNFPFRFKVRGRKGSEGYSGKKAASERETQAIVSFLKNLKKETTLCALVNYHAMGQLVFGSYLGKKENVGKETRALYVLARRFTGYKDSSIYSAGKIGNSNLRDYALYGLHIPCITLEVGRSLCPCDYHEYNSIFNKNKYVVMETAAYYEYD